MPSLTACRCRLHMGVKKCENPDVPCGAGVFLASLLKVKQGAVLSDEMDDTLICLAV